MATVGDSGKSEPLIKNRNQALTIAEAEEQWPTLSYRERMRAFFHESQVANYTLPVFVILAITVVLGLIWFAVFWYGIRDASQDFFSERNMRKFIYYNVLHGVLGFGASSGPLGLKFKYPFGNTMLMFMTPGTLCSPTLPWVVGCFQKVPARRSLLHVLLFIAYVAALVYAIVDPSFKRAHIVNSIFLLLTIFDFTVFLASRGEHYGYMMLSLSFPDWIAGCQWVQLVLWIMVGVSKCGPWFKYVIQTLVKDSIVTPCLPPGFITRLFNKDFDNGDFSPSRAAHCLGAMGALGEWILPLCCVIGPPGTTVNTVGVFGMMGYHCFIWCTLPTASVFEWQYYTIVLTYFLYRLHPIGLPTSPPLIVLLVIALVIFPVVGQLKPTLVPFLLAYRQYAGNWRMGTFFLKKSAKAKFDKLKTWEPIYFWENAPPEAGGDKADFKFGSAFMPVPQFRGLVSIIEVFLEKTGTSVDDYMVIPSHYFVNCVNGWNLGGGWEISRECWRKAFVEVCGLEPGEGYSIMMEPVEPLPPYNLAYRVMDLAKGPLEAEVYAKVPYVELENCHPLDVHIKKERITSGKSIRGLFLDTYYI